MYRPQEIHKHHIVPRYLGGTDDESNLISLSRYDHSIEHLILYYKFGNKQDLCAYYMLKSEMEEFRKIYASLGGKATQRKRKEQGLNCFGKDPNSEFMREISSINGKKQGRINLENGTMTRAREKSNLSEAGKKGSIVCREKQVNAFFDPNLRQEIASKGGKIQGRKNVESGHLARISKIPRKYKGMMWVTDGIDSKMILKTEDIPDGYRKGRTIKKENKI